MIRLEKHRPTPGPWDESRLYSKVIPDYSSRQEAPYERKKDFHGSGDDDGFSFFRRRFSPGPEQWLAVQKRLCSQGMGSRCHSIISGERFQGMPEPRPADRRRRRTQPRPSQTRLFQRFKRQTQTRQLNRPIFLLDAGWTGKHINNLIHFFQDGLAQGPQRRKTMRYSSIFIAVAAIFFFLFTSIPAQAQVVQADMIQQDRGRGHGGGRGGGHGGGYHNPGRGGRPGYGGGHPGYGPPRYHGPRSGYHRPRYHHRPKHHHRRHYNNPSWSFPAPFPFIPVPIPVPFPN